jgi:DNA mismatch endonuclease, patch repair protein
LRVRKRTSAPTTSLPYKRLNVNGKILEYAQLADRFSVADRSRIMSRIRGKGTQPELQLHAVLHSLRLDFEPHPRDILGTPDAVVRRRKIAVFVHGCFWHAHPGCRRATTPSTNVAFWSRKIEGNRSRDLRVTRQLRELGWSVVTIWACRPITPDSVASQLRRTRNIRCQLSTVLVGGRNKRTL